MRTRTVRSVLSLILFCALLTACGGTAPGPSADEVATAVAATFQALTPPIENAPPATDTPPAPTATTAPTPTLLPTAFPAPVLPQGSYVPLEAMQCEGMRANFEQAIGAPVTIETAPFSDRMTGGSGSACRVLATGTGANYGIGGPYGTLYNLVLSLGWSEDMNYGAGGPRGMLSGFRNGSTLGLLSVGWQPSADANCPTDQPISACPLTAEQKLFTITFDLAKPIVYIPLPADQCDTWQTIVQASMPVTLVLETVEFDDLSGNVGTACQIRGAGNGLDFTTMPNIANTLGNLFASAGWALVNGADGPTGTVRVYTLGNQTAVLTVVWRPSEDANCPANQPISSCVLTPQQKLFTVTVALAQK